MSKSTIRKTVEAARKTRNKPAGKPPAGVGILSAADPIMAASAGQQPEGTANSGRKPCAPSAVKDLILAVFRDAPDKEFSATNVIHSLNAKHPTINESSVRFMIGELKKADQVHRVRNDGHIAILKFGPRPEGKTLPVKPSTAATVKASPVGTRDGLATLRVLTKLVERRTELDKEIERFKKML